MTKREPTRNVFLRPKKAGRWARPWMIAFFAFLILNVGIAFVLKNASPVINTIWEIAFGLGFAGLIVVAAVLGLKSRQCFRIVSTLYWTEPKKIKRILAWWDIRRRGLISFAKPMILLGLVISSCYVLMWLLSWANSLMDPSKQAVPIARVLLLVAVVGVGLPALLFLAYVLEMLFTSRVVGFDSQWMGFLQGIPYRALWPYERIARVRFESLRVDGQEFRLMVVTPREGREVEFGLSEGVDEGRVVAFLASKGVEVCRA
jgi:hypothetical protein